MWYTADTIPLIIRIAMQKLAVVMVVGKGTRMKSDDPSRFDTTLPHSGSLVDRFFVSERVEMKHGGAAYRGGVINVNRFVGGQNPIVDTST